LKWKQGLEVVLTLCLLVLFAGCKDIDNKEALSASTSSKAEPTSQVVQPKPTYPYYEFQGTDRVWGYLDQDSNPFLAPKFRSAEWFDKNGLAIVSISNEGQEPQFGLIDQSGHYVIDPEYFSIKSHESDNRYIAHKRNGSAIFDSQGNLIQTFEGYIGELAEGKASILSGKNMVIWMRKETSSLNPDLLQRNLFTTVRLW
jgi:hypothetical protein